MNKINFHHDFLLLQNMLHQPDDNFEQRLLNQIEYMGLDYEMFFNQFTSMTNFLIKSGLDEAIPLHRRLLQSYSYVKKHAKVNNELH